MNTGVSNQTSHDVQFNHVFTSSAIFQTYLAKNTFETRIIKSSIFPPFLLLYLKCHLLNPARSKNYIILHELPLGKLTSKLSFLMNIHMIGKYPDTSADPDIFLRGGVPPKTHSSYYMILWFPDFNGCKPFTRKVNISSSNPVDVSTIRTFFFFFNDCILHKCCAISNQYHFTNPISTFLPKFQGGSGPPVPSSGSAHVIANWKINNKRILSCTEDDLIVPFLTLHKITLGKPPCWFAMNHVIGYQLVKNRNDTIIVIEIA